MSQPPYDQTPGTEPSGPQNWKERQYEKLRGKVSIKALNILITVLMIAFFAVVAIGALVARK